MQRNCIFIGPSARPANITDNFEDCVTIGDGALCVGNNGVSIGNGINSGITTTTNDCTAIGDGTECTGDSAVSIGNGPYAAENSVAIGDGVQVSGQESVGFGYPRDFPMVSGFRSIVIGTQNGSIGSKDNGHDDVTIVGGGVQATAAHNCLPRQPYND